MTQDEQNERKPADEAAVDGPQDAQAQPPGAEPPAEAQAATAAAEPPQPAESQEGPPEASSADDTLAGLKAEVSDLKDQLLRSLAETENLRRRAQREREDLQRYAGAGLARDLLGVADNLRRALESVGDGAAGGDEGLKTLIEGIQLTEKELLAAFEKNHIIKLDPVGEKLDPHRHEAMFEMPSPDHANGTVVQVLQSGYLLHDRLLRAARVGVAKNPAAAPEPKQATSEPGSQVDTSA